METDRRAIGGSGNPEVEILATLACLEEEDHVAGVQVCQGIQEEVVSSLFFLRVKLCLFVRVGEERSNVCQ